MIYEIYFMSFKLDPFSAFVTAVVFEMMCHVINIQYKRRIIRQIHCENVGEKSGLHVYNNYYFPHFQDFLLFKQLIWNLK